MKSIKLKNMMRIALFSSLIFVSSNISIIIPLGITNTRLHLGNVFCALSGMIIGPIYGGIASGIGSFFFDIINPLFISSAPFTFLSKFLLAFIAGKFFEKTKKIIFSSFLGCFSYVILYIIKSFITNMLLGMNFNANLTVSIQQLVISSINASTAVIASSILYKTFKKFYNIN